ncbi:uncharacterized protein LOC108890346 [Lates calcarifer]|uniref:Uncharacterized protein LOC108890346 n=1 Tax=Lates calcarifer TaxID=8187 RepID=A0AAJ7V9Z7_LATCA|nr:uncharacterized protein LOC108890346 [Lates calcarifer]
MDVADKLVDKIFSWVKLQRECADKLRKLATELKEKKKSANVTKIVGSTVSVGGAAAAAAAGALAFFTGGLAIPVLAATGAVASGVGLATSVGSDIVDVVISNCAINDAKQISKEIEDLEKELQKLTGSLKEEQQAGDHSEDHVMERILRAMAKRNGLKLPDNISLYKMMFGLSKSFSGDNSDVIRLGLTLLLNFVQTAAVKGLTTIVGYSIGKKLAANMGKKAANKTAGRIAGGAVGLLFSVPELIIHCQNVNNCETEISQSLRENADIIRTAAEELEKALDQIRRMLEEISKRQREQEEKRRQREQEEREKRRRHREQKELLLGCTVVVFVVFLAFLAFRTFLSGNSSVSKESNHETNPLINDKRSKISESITENNLDLFGTTETWFQRDTTNDVFGESAPKNVKYYRQSRDSGRGEVVVQFSQVIKGKQILFDIIMSLDHVQDKNRNQETSDESQTDQTQEDKRGDQTDQSRGEQERERDQNEESGGEEQEGDDQEDDQRDDEDEESDQSEEKSDNSTVTNKTNHDTNQSPRGTITMGLLNVRSINKKKSNISQLLKQLNMSVFCITETWTKKETAEKVLRESSAQNHSVCSVSREGQGGGAAIQYLLSCKHQSNHSDFITTFQYVATVLQHDAWDTSVLVINVYHPPKDNLTRFNTFLNELQMLLDVFENSNNIIITGDFNIHVNNDKKTSTKLFKEFLKNNTLLQHVKVPTHKGNNTLDLVITKNVEIFCLSVINYNISDHCLIKFKARPESTNDEQVKRFKSEHHSGPEGQNTTTI